MNNLYHEQQVAHDNLVHSRGGLLFWKVGTGKTRVALETFATLQKVYKWEFPCICLFVCKPKCFFDIRMETIKIGFDCVILENDYEVPSLVVENMQTKPTLLLVSHAMLDKKLEYLDANNHIKMVLLDDGYLFKNPRVAKTKAANKLTKSRRAILMSGSVMTQNNLEDIYGQAYAVNQHRRIAPNLTRFHTEYMNWAITPVSPVPKGTNKPNAKKRIVEALGDAANFYFPENRDRKIHNQIIKVPATAEQSAMFTELREWFSLSDYNVQLNSALQVSQKLQQISNGWTTLEDGTQVIVPNNKITRLITLVEDILAAGERCVIWCAFRADIDLLAKLVPFATLQMSGSHKFNPYDWITHKANVALCTEASGVGFNHFEQCPYAIYFSMDWKWVSLQQSRGRNDRHASRHNEVFYYYLQTDEGIDDRIYDTAIRAERGEDNLISLGMINNWCNE